MNNKGFTFRDLMIGFCLVMGIIGLAMAARSCSDYVGDQLATYPEQVKSKVHNPRYICKGGTLYRKQMGEETLYVSMAEKCFVNEEEKADEIR